MISRLIHKCVNISYIKVLNLINKKKIVKTKLVIAPIFNSIEMSIKQYM